MLGGGVACSQKTVSKCATDCKHELNIRQSWQCFLGPESCFTAVQKECATPPHVRPTSSYDTACDQTYQAFPRDSTASDKRWGEKAWVRGYVQPRALCKKPSALTSQFSKEALRSLEDFLFAAKLPHKCT